MNAVEHLTYTSGGLACTADLYRPADSTSPVPGIVCAESGAKVKEMVAAPAHYLVQAGFAVLAIDYRTFGGSEGEPRGQLFPERQAEDVRNAVTLLRQVDGVDPGRVGVWGNSIAASVVIAAAIADRRIACVVAQSPSELDGWRTTRSMAGSRGFARLRADLAEDFEQRAGRIGGGRTIPWLQFGKAGDDVSQGFVDLAEEFPSFRNEILLESYDHLLAWAPGAIIDRLAPTPLLIVANGGEDPYHELEELQRAYRAAGEPKRLDILPFDAMGFYTEPGTGEAMRRATSWFTQHLTRT